MTYSDMIHLCGPQQTLQLKNTVKWYLQRNYCNGTFSNHGNQCIPFSFVHSLREL